MNNLVFKGANDQAVTNSMLVAEKFGKEHRHVLNAIRDLVKGCAENSANHMFYETTYVNTQNKQEYPMFIMNRDGFTLLAMGFTGKKALGFKMDFINAFNKMEAMLKSDDYILMRSQQILKKRLDMAEQKVQLLQSQSKALSRKNSELQYQNDYLQSCNDGLQASVEKMRPAAVFAKAISTSPQSVLVKELAMMISQITTIFALTKNCKT